MNVNELEWESRPIPEACLIFQSDEGNEVILNWRTIRQMFQYVRGYDSFPYMTQQQMDVLKREGLAFPDHGGSITPSQAFMDWFDKQ